MWTGLLSSSHPYILLPVPMLSWIGLGDHRNLGCKVENRDFETLDSSNEQPRNVLWFISPVFGAVRIPFIEKIWHQKSVYYISSSSLHIFIIFFISLIHACSRKFILKINSSQFGPFFLKTKNRHNEGRRSQSDCKLSTVESHNFSAKCMGFLWTIWDSTVLYCTFSVFH